MNLQQREMIQRLFTRLSNDMLGSVAAEQREALQQLLQQRNEELLRDSAGSGSDGGFADLIGLSGKPGSAFEGLPFPSLQSDFSEAVIPTQIHAAAELYYIYQHERMKVFQVVDVILREFHAGSLRIQSGPGARALYLLEKHRPLRYSAAQRLQTYKRAFNYGTATTVAHARVNQRFHTEFVAFTAAVAQYFRDLLIGDVIRGAHTLNQRPFGSQATIERLGIDLRWNLDRATFGHMVALTLETGNYLKSVLDMFETPDIKKVFDANTKWDVIEYVTQQHLGGGAMVPERIQLAESGRRLLMFIADNPLRTSDFNLFQTQIQPLGTVAEQWIAAYRMTPEGRNFTGVADSVRSVLGTGGRRATIEAGRGL